MQKDIGFGWSFVSLVTTLNNQLKIELLLFMITAIYSLPGADGPGGGGAAMKILS